jgi:hypothetical protein
VSLHGCAGLRSSLGAIAGVAGAFALGACGSTASDRLGSGDAAKLKGELAAVQAAAAGGERSRALAALATFSAQVQRLRASGRLDLADARALGLGARQAIGAAGRELPAPAPVRAATVPAPAPAPVPPPTKPKGEPKPKHDANKHGHGHGDHGGD